MSREKNIFEKFPQNWQKQPFAERVVGERGQPTAFRQGGGENMDLERHYEHKQHAFDSFCKKVCCGARPSMPTVPLGAGRTDLCR